MPLRIAIIGSGISGLGAAWALHRDHDVTVFEKDGRVGGHSNTVDVLTPDGPIAVDTGFIVYNEATYPNLTRLLTLLGVETEWTDMSFSYSAEGGIEYSTRWRGIVAQPTNLLRGRFRRMLRDIGRFRREGRSLEPGPHEEIGDLLARHRYSSGFIADYLIPMTGAIWSTPPNRMLHFPARSILAFLDNHGLIEITNRPRWRTVTGGSREYVRRLIRPFAERILVSTPVTGVTRDEEGATVLVRGGAERFDHVVMATHADQALGILGGEASPEERRLLSRIRYQPNRLVLHSDASSMPARRAAWASWNARGDSDPHGRPASVTYWMNRLQNLSEPLPLFASLNPTRDPDPRHVHGEFSYAHPQFDQRAVDAQRELGRIQGRHRTWFAGAWLGYGFHEDGLRSGLEVAAALGSRAPWRGGARTGPAPAAVREPRR